MSTRPLNAAEQTRLDDAIAAFVQMVQDAGLHDDDNEAGTLELADELLIRWSAEPPRSRLAADIFATIIGAAVGDFLIHTMRVKWGVESVPDGATGLVDEATGEPLFSPFDAVRDRLEEAGDGFVPDLADEIMTQLGHLRREPG